MRGLLLACAVALAFAAGWYWRAGDVSATAFLLISAGLAVLGAHVCHLLARKWRSPLIADVRKGRL
ncbi:hypothetical protein [Arenimonas alkanexedens]